MTAILAALLAGVASAALGLRARMLKPELDAFYDAPACVRWATFGLSLTLALYVVGVVEGHEPTRTELGLLAALAVYAVLLTVNLARQTRPVDEPPDTAGPSA